MEKESSKNKVVRQLKIYPKHISRSRNGLIVIPEIRLCGVWLSKINFKPGQSITVTCEENRITITNNRIEGGGLTDIKKL